MALAQTVTADGTTVIIPSDTTVTSSSYGLLALNAGVINAGPVTVNTAGTNAHSVYAQTGSTISLYNATITASGSESVGIVAIGAGANVIVSNSDVRALAGRGIRIEGGASVVATNVTTFAQNNHAGVYVNGVGSSLTYNGGTVSTAGTGSPGVDVRSQATAELSDLTITTSANGSMGIQVLSGGRVDARNVDISTGTGTTAYGASASGAGSVLNYEGGSIKTATSRGLVAASGGTVNASNLDIGSNVIAVFANTNSSLTLANSTVSTHGDDARGINIQDRVIGTISDTKVTTDGNLAYGLSAASNSQMTATNVAVETSGENAYGVRATGTETQIDVIAGSYITHGLGASGIRATDNAVVNTDLGSGVGSGNTIITTTGEGSAGIFASTAATVNATGSQIMTLGIGSHGAVADTGATVNLVDGGLSTRGANANGLMATGGGLINIAGSTVQTYGVDSVGVSLADDSRATLDHTYVDAYFGPALKTESGNVTFDLKSGANVVGFTGTVLTAASGTTTTLMADGKSYLGGDMVAEANDAVIDASLSNGSQWRGAARGVTSASIDGTSYWRMTGSSDVGTLINDGVIEFDAANPYKTLTAGSLAMNGGSFILNTKLNEGGAASETDKIVVTGATSGTGSLKVLNAGGPGALTVADGIQVIQVDGASNATFTLLGDYVHEGAQAVVGGAYAYKLYHNGISDPADGDWYLRSVLKDPTEPPVEPPVCTPGVDCPVEPPVDPVTPPEPPLYQAGTPVYEAYPQLLLGLNGLPTLQQRVGNRYWNNGGNRIIAEGADAIGSPYAPSQEAGSFIEQNGVWGRIEGAHNRIDPRFSTTNAGYDFNTYKIQAGLDGMLAESEAGKLIGGVSVHYARGSANIRSVYDADNGGGDIRTDGYGIGGTLTWYGESGFYVDTQAQATWYDSDLGFDGGNATLSDGNHGFGYALSMESGKRITLDPAWSLTPQAQLVWSSVDFDDFSDVFGADVRLDRGRSLQGRLGLALDHQTSWYNANGLIDRTQFYAITNLYYEFLEGTKVSVAGTSFANGNERLWGGIGLGGSYNWNSDKYSIYGEGSVNTSLAQFADSYSLKGTMGFRVKW
uniref:Outer membrane autotransporter barrel domain-containing protein n=1 Tax=Ochrobactrum sp. LM19 TaxID=1449781 RepID=A0A0D5A0I6_9HYPH|nr:outer membrane autotransporter barrel domain-containing protein [Ochrobactrum sp. LM19]